MNSYKWIMRILYGVTLLLYLYFLVDGWAFYTTPYAERPFHEQYRYLRPAGFQGHGFGIVGSAMMIFMLLYSARKRWRFMRHWGLLRHWLDVHIYFGIFGPLFVILHSAFKVQGLIAVSFWSMILVMCSGILGRYLYLKIPRDVTGEELSLRQLQEQEKELVQALAERYRLDTSVQERIQALADMRRLESLPLLILLFTLFFQDIVRPFRMRRFRQMLRRQSGLSAKEAKTMSQLVQQKITLHQKVVLINKIHRLFHYWHVFHKPFAIIMYLIMFVHVGISVWLGYTWIF
ncbi:MAG: hypothetical protein GXO78_01710 [Calditrichaeota bacterium]|nr:hypothetical protein [Calditrichota bacterium]